MLLPEFYQNHTDPLAMFWNPWLLVVKKAELNLLICVQVLRERNGRYGVAGVCNGGGGASAAVLELM